MEIAAGLRTSLKCSSPWFPILHVAEFDLPTVKPEFALTIGDIEEMGENHGLTFPESHEIRLRSDVYQGVRDGKGRDRFTLAHELGHYLLHSAPGLARSMSPVSAVPTYKNSEWQANTFAGSLLISVEMARLVADAEELASICGVTVDAARVQLSQYRLEGMLP